MRKVKVLTAFFGAVISVTGSGALFASETINSVTVETKIVEYADEMTVTTAASIETTAVPETTTTEQVTTTTEETTTTTEETTTSTTTTTTTEQTTVTTTAAPQTTPAPVTTAAPETTPAPATEAAPAETAATEAASNALTISWSDYVLLCNVVGNEYGSDWVPLYDKALVVEVVMNRVNSASFPNTIYGVLTQRNQFSGSSAYVSLGTFSSKVTASVKAAVDLYLSDPTQFNHGYLYFSGNGKTNFFH